ncbi:MAG: hypothetical protein K2X27_22775 [Candidatus Obscuribacterales bacterium]|nr:hypothetical protein [Candidatus Obscuribacterales bacterium]
MSDFESSDAKNENRGLILPIDKERGLILPEDEERGLILPENKDRSLVLPESTDSEHIVPKLGHSQSQAFPSPSPEKQRKRKRSNEKRREADPSIKIALIAGLLFLLSCFGSLFTNLAKDHSLIERYLEAGAVSALLVIAGFLFSYTRKEKAIGALIASSGFACLWILAYASHYVESWRLVSDPRISWILQGSVLLGFAIIGLVDPVLGYCRMPISLAIGEVIFHKLSSLETITIDLLDQRLSATSCALAISFVCCIGQSLWHDKRTEVFEKAGDKHRKELSIFFSSAYHLLAIFALMFYPSMTEQWSAASLLLAAGAVVLWLSCRKSKSIFKHMSILAPTAASMLFACGLGPASGPICAATLLLCSLLGLAYRFADRRLGGLEDCICMIYIYGSLLTLLLMLPFKLGVAQALPYLPAIGFATTFFSLTCKDRVLEYLSKKLLPLGLSVVFTEVLIQFVSVDLSLSSTGRFISFGTFAVSIFFSYSTAFVKLCAFIYGQENSNPLIKKKVEGFTLGITAGTLCVFLPGCFLLDEPSLVTTAIGINAALFALFYVLCGNDDYKELAYLTLGCAGVSAIIYDCVLRHGNVVLSFGLIGAILLLLTFIGTRKTKTIE